MATRDRVTVALGERGYDVVVGSGAADELGALLAGRSRVAIVSQPGIADRHLGPVTAALAAAGCAHEVFLIGDGEAAKSLDTVERLCEAMARWGVRRGDAVVALGGGLVGDVAGFTASVYYRGIPFVQVPTTLLAMVDAAIGGKTGVNLTAGKNLVGAFHQPLGVLADPETLTTLPDAEFRSGLGEVAKYALMGDEVLLGVVHDQREALTAREPGVLRDVVARSAAIKADYVARDEYERTGVRAFLNYGHTLAHGIETVAEYAMAHGEAVAVGLVFAGRLAEALERIDAAAADRHEAVVAGLGLPVAVPAGLTAAALLTVMARDKKSAGGLTFVLQGPSGLELVDDPPPAAVHAALGRVGVAG